MRNFRKNKWKNNYFTLHTLLLGIRSNAIRIWYFKYMSLVIVPHKISKTFVLNFLVIVIFTVTQSIISSPSLKLFSIKCPSNEWRSFHVYATSIPERVEPTIHKFNAQVVPWRWFYGIHLSNRVIFYWGDFYMPTTFGQRINQIIISWEHF